MLTLRTKLNLDLKVIKSPNLTSLFERDDLDKIGNYVYDSYERDVHSREGWVRRTEAAMDLAMQIQQEKNFPWPNCANIAFPLVTIAALQFHSRAYPAIVNGRSVVQCRVIGEDKDGISAARAERISKHMSWQLLEQDDSWEESQDRALLNVPIVGTAFKKTYYDSSKGHNVSDLVLAKDLVLDYWAKSVENCPVKTHIIPLYRNEIHERVLRKQFYDCTNDSWFMGAAQPQGTTHTENSDNRAGLSRPDSDHNTPFVCLEQHCVLDLDGDGYAEPYIVTIEESSKQVLRIVTRFDRIEDIEYDSSRRIIRIDAMEYFTKIPFIPSPDGGIMDIGFGVLLGPLNESVNSAINQLFDAGTVSNTAGGFLGRGAKIRGGLYQFQPFSWNRVDTTGDDLRKNIFPLPVREPSAVMFNLLSLLIDYTSRISGATDMMAGENPGQNTPAETSRAMLEQGSKIYSAIFKRIWRSLKQEFKKLYTLNSIYLPATFNFGEGASVRREDYSGGSAGVVPAADPTIASDGARFAQATLLKTAASSTPGYNMGAVERKYLKSLGIDEVETLYPGVENLPPAAPDVKIQIQDMKNQLAMQQLENNKQQFMLSMMMQQKLNDAKIAQLMATAGNLEAKASVVGEDMKINAFRAGLEAIREQNKQFNTQIDTMMEAMRNGTGNETGQGGALSTMAGAPSNPAANAFSISETGGAEGSLG